MKEYTVNIKETLERYVKITAGSEQEATDKVEAAWKNGEHILDYENFQGVEFEIVKFRKMEDYEDLKMSEFTRETPLGVAMVKAAYNMGRGFFPNLYHEEVQTTLRKTDVEFLMDNIRFFIVDDDLSAMQKFSRAQGCPSFPDDSTIFLLRYLDSTFAEEMKALSNDCYAAINKGIIDGYMDTMRDIIHRLEPIGSYPLPNGTAIEIYHIDHTNNEVLASLVAANAVEELDKLYPPAWCKICEGDDPESECGRGQGFLYSKVFIPFSQTIRKGL